jgi:hypothetical protein
MLCSYRRHQRFFLLGLAMLLLAAFVPTILGEPVSGRSLRSLAISPSFEEDRRPLAPARYAWRNLGFVASFQAGGSVLLSGADGPAARLTFPGSALTSEPRGEAASVQKALYYVGPSGNWRSASHFERVRYPQIYPGIDLVFITNSGQLEYNFEVSPHADPSVIRMHYENARAGLDGEGNLRVDFAGTTILQRRPQAFQRDGMRMRAIACNYRLEETGDVTLRTASYDRNSPLVVDPVLIFSTYLGGSSFDAIYGAARDAAGNLYLVGETASGSLTSNTVATRSSRDVFVAKMNAAGTQLLYTVYLGGSGMDSGKAIAVDASGNAYVTGVTSSSDFPVTSGALSVHSSGAEDAFVAKLDASGQLLYSTYLGGEKSDYGYSIAVDGSGAVYVAGQTSSTAFPVTSGAFQASNHGGLSDCFVSKLNAAGNALVYSTLLGGGGLDSCAGLAIDAAGNAYVAGTTYSTDFPTLAPLQSNLRGTANAFAAKLNPAGSALVYATFLGGSGLDNANAVALDSSGSLYVAGCTSSVDFPATAGAAQITLTGSYNAFVSKLSADGSALVYGTLIGGSRSDTATSIAVDPTGRAIVGGYTSSSDFPVVAPVQSAFQGAFDAFATVVDAGGGSFVFSSYFGGSGDDRAYAIAALPGNNLILGGMTSSGNFPTVSAMQNGLGVAPDAFALVANYAAGVTVGPVTPSSGSGVSQTFVLQYSDTAGAGNLSMAWVWFNATLANSATTSCLIYYSRPANTLYLLNDWGLQWNGVAMGAGGTLQNSQCSINAGATTATTNGNTLTVNLALTFSSAFSGSKNVYLWANDVGGTNSGWQTRGSWTVPNAVVSVTADSVTPSSGSGLNQAFALQYSDNAGASRLATVWLSFNATPTGSSFPNSCVLYYSQETNLLYLENDAGSQWNQATLGSNGTLQNSQCSISLAGTTVSTNGNSLTLNLAMRFSSGFNGSKNVYLLANDAGGTSSGWQTRGTWTVPNAVLSVTADSVTPSSGSGTIQTFALQYSDTAGAGNLSMAWVWFNATLANSAASSCLIYYSLPVNTLYLLNDGATGWSAVVVGTGGTLQNNQCSVSLSGSSVSTNGMALTLNLAMTFSSAFSGSKSVYLFASDAGGTSSGWQARGSWTVVSTALSVTADSVTPSSGSGPSQTFTLQYSDTAGAASLSTAWIWINASLANSAANSCLIYYNRPADTLYLLNDGATQWYQVVLSLGGALQNSRCSVNVGGATVSINGNAFTLKLPMTFYSAFSGSKNIYMWVSDAGGTNSGWQTKGAWTVP